LTAIYHEHIAVLADEGVDFILLETFTHVREAHLAAETARKFGKPVFVSITVGKDGETRRGEQIEHIVDALDRDPCVDGIGINCGIGPAAALSVAERALPHTTKPFTVMANAGVPQEVDGRMIYMTTPEYFTEYAKSMIQIGVRGVGGCCGTTPEHIAMMSRTVKSLTGVKKHVEISHYEDPEPDIRVIPMAEKCAFAARLARGAMVTSVEITPPRSIDLTPMLDKCRVCRDAGIDAINIPDGPRASARISPMVAALAIEREVGIETVLHYCCRDRNLIGMQSDLLGGYAGGLRNYLIITGDPPKLGDYPDSTPVFDVDAVGLTKVVHNLNHGRDVGGNLINPPTGILIGVGANPCAVEPERELNHYMNKIAAGAEYAITQPVCRGSQRGRHSGRRRCLAAGFIPQCRISQHRSTRRRGAGRHPGTDEHSQDQGGWTQDRHRDRPGDPRPHFRSRRRISGQRPVRHGRSGTASIGMSPLFLVAWRE
jgi:hypothetical protein